MSNMNVNGATSTQASYQASSVKTNSKAKAESTDSKAKTETKSEEAAVYEKSKEPDKKAPYSINKMSEKDRANLVQKLKQEELVRKNQFTDLVQKMLKDQAGVSNLADLFSAENLKNVSAADIAQAKEDVSEDGYW